MSISVNKIFKTTDVFKANYDAKTDIVINQGGTSSGKTYSIVQCLFLHAIEDDNQVITVVGQDIPNLKVGAIRDAQTIIDGSEILQSFIVEYNKSDRIYTFINGSIIEFKSYDDWQDAKSGKRDYLFLNEANGVAKPVWDELYIRTKKKSYIDYNPNTEFWVHSDLIGKDNVTLIISDHRHNTFLEESIHNKIEAIEDEELWKVYARGLTGKLEGVIFRDYNVIPNVSLDAKLIGYGLDFGFTNDPTALIAVYNQSGELVLDELIYQKRLLNSDINNLLRELNISGTIVADSAEPKSIAELQSYGWYVEPAKKGADSIRQSINTLKKYKINVTQRSHNLKAELNSYKWKQNKDGKLENQPVDFMNHSIDAIRYVCLNLLDNVAQGKYSFM
jgi:phage terminase large subunit